jgi:hypothetical protein
MLHLWALLGFVGPLPLPPVIPPGPLAGALLVGLAVYNVMQLIQPPWAPNNSRGRRKQLTPESDHDISWNYRAGPGTLWVIQARAYSSKRCGGWCPFNGHRVDLSNPNDPGSPGDILPGPNSSTVAIRRIETVAVGDGESGLGVYLSAIGDGGDIVKMGLPAGVGTSFEVNIYPVAYPPGQTDAGPSFPELPSAFIPSPYFEPQSDPERKPLAPPSPSPTPAPAPPATPDKAEPTTPDGRPGSNPDGTPAAPPAPGTPPTPTPVPLGVPGPTPGGGSPSFPPAPVPGGVLRSTGQTGAPQANPAAVGAPGTSGAPQFRPTTADGQVQPQPAPGPSTTPAGQKTIAGTQVQPLRVPETIAGVAQELGRVESKLESLLRGADRSGNPTNALENFSNLLGLVQLIYDILTEDVAAAEYEITAPCDKDELGNPLKFQRSFPAEDYGPATLRRTEAILDALATLARWKHRTCAPMGGQPVNNVTITAYEVMEP